MRKEYNLAMEWKRLAVGLTKQAWGAGPGAHELQDAAAPEAVPDGEDLVLLHQVEGAHLRGATASRHALNSCGHVMQCDANP